MLFQHRDEILSRAWCEILFARRNRAYGAYTLRAQAGRRYALALGILLGIFLLMGLLAGGTYAYFYFRFKDEAERAAKALRDLRHEKLRDGYELKFQATTQVMAPIRVEQKGETTAVPEITDALTQIKEFGIKGIAAVSPDEELLLIAAPNPEVQDTAAVEQSKERIVPTEMVKSMPRFPGGNRAFMRWLDQNIQYPHRARQLQLEVKSMLSFVVLPNGTIDDVALSPAPPDIIAKEVRRAMKLMPRWDPGRGEDGTPTPVMISVPLEFHFTK